jgi:plasmid maintenance system antidote protein VapI
MKPLGLTVNRLALDLHLPATRIGEIVHERRRITAETAQRRRDTSIRTLNSGSICRTFTS